MPPQVDDSPEGEGVPEAATDEPHEVEAFQEERTAADRERDYPREDRPRERDRGGRGDRGGRDRGYDRGGGRDRDRDRDRGRGYERDRNVYRILRSQIDRIRHSLESVVRDLDRVLGTIQEAERERQLTEQELDSLHEQIDQLQRGGGRGGYDRGHRRHDEERRD